MHVQYVVPLIVATVCAADVLCAAMRRANVAQKAVAIDMGVNEPYLSRALSGEKSINFARLLQCEPVMLRALGEVLIEAAGGEPPLTRSALRHELAHVARLVMARPEMARARRTA